MTDRELMQMALETLEEVQMAITTTPWLNRRIEALRARLAQSELEPVAQMREMLEVQGRDGTWNYDTYSQGMYNGMEFMVALAEGREPVFRDPPEKWLHAPPQREFIGLTDEEREEATGWSVEHIEAKLKQKNA